MATMKALFQNQYGDPLKEMQLGTLPIPTPTPTQVLIRVHAASLNPIDLKRNSMGLEEVFPIIVGYDVAGVVEEVGSEATRFQKGDRVYGSVLPGGLSPKLSGSVAEHVVCEQHLLVAIPAGRDFVQAAALPVAAFTAVAVLDLTRCKTGDKVFVTAGAGGVGVHLMQLAKNVYGAAEVATTASAAKTDFVKQYGADHVVDYKTDDAGEVLAGWADVVIDCTGELEMGKKVLRDGGQIITIVAFSQSEVKPYMLEPTREIIDKLTKAFAEGKVVSVVDRAYKMDEAMDAVKHLADGHARGKVVIKVTDE